MKPKHCGVLLASWLCTGGAFAQDVPNAKIELKRLSDDRWQARWTFSEPVEAFRVYPPRLGFRSRSWQFPAGSRFSLDETDEGGVIRHADAKFETLAVEFARDSGFEPKTYVPVLPFSDGGAGIYSGHFSGDVLISGDWHATPTQFTLTGLEGEQTLLPSWTSEGSPVYVYFGPQSPLESSQAQVIADREMPQWLLDVFEKSVPGATAVFSERLELALDRKPLVLIAAGELRDSDGYSVKGAGLDGQFTVMLQGTGLLIESAERRRMFEKMLAHELLHIWQQAMPGGDFNSEQPWLHEGSADALAVHALYQSGAWSREELDAFDQEQRQSCSDSLADATLEAAAEQGNWTAIYACGYLEFTEGVADPFAFWLELTRAAHSEGVSYTQDLLERLRKADSGI